MHTLEETLVVWVGTHPYLSLGGDKEVASLQGAVRDGCEGVLVGVEGGVLETPIGGHVVEDEAGSDEGAFVGSEILLELEPWEGTTLTRIALKAVLVESQHRRA